MVQKKLDPKIRGLIENSVRKGHRSFFVIVGDYGLYQVENIHKILSKCRVKARPSVLWCYKKELAFSSHRKKRMKQIKKNQARGLHDPDRDDPFELFISSTNIRWTYYKETEKVLGQTFGMCVLQDFEALTPNLLARTIETVEGGGIIVILLKTVKSLKQLYTMSMDVHARYRTEACNEVIPRFNERFILSLAECSSCLVVDDELNVLPLSSKVTLIPSEETASSGLADGDADLSGVKEDPNLVELKASMADTPNAGQLVALAKTLDQAKAVLSFLDAISEKTMRSTVSLTAARGRGKSAAVGLCLAGAIAYGYSNIFVTAPSPENLKTVFEFVLSGLRALKYTEHLDFEVLYEQLGDAGKVPVRVNVFRGHRQTIQYILPSDHLKLAQAELVAIDEAAAIPLPLVKKLLGPYLVFMSSTVNGYEGTGRALSLKLIQQLRAQQGAATVEAARTAAAAVSGPRSKKSEHRVHEERWKAAATAVAATASGSGSGSGRRVLTEITLDTPIRYSSGDAVEAWLNRLLCLDVTTHSFRIVTVLPAPKDCELYLVDRDALFSYHPLAEALLQRVWALYTSAHYKNSPSDLQMLSDAPAHRLYILLGPRAMERSAASGTLPDVLCVVQVAFEGRISQKSVQSELGRGNKASGDMIPWTLSQQFNDSEFASLSGARIVRIATHPDVQHMGYGSRAMDILVSYFQGELSEGCVALGSLGDEGDPSAVAEAEGDNEGDDVEAGLAEERVAPRSKLPPLLTNLSEHAAEVLHWLGVSFGLTAQLLNFWSRKHFKVCYIRQSTSDITGEHSSLMLRELSYRGNSRVMRKEEMPASGWLDAFVTDYRRRLVALLSYTFRDLETSVALTLLDPDRKITSTAVDEDSDVPVDTTAPSPSGSAAVQGKELLSVHFNMHDLRRLELYARNMVDHHMVLDLLPTLSRLLFLGRLPAVRLSALQVAILLAVGLQHRDVDALAREMDLPVNQVLAFFNKTVRKLSSAVRALVESQVEAEMSSEAVGRSRISVAAASRDMDALPVSLSEDQDEDVRSFMKTQKKLLLANKDLNRHTVDVDALVLQSALEKGMKRQNAVPNTISVPVVRTVNKDASEGGTKRVLEGNTDDVDVDNDGEEEHIDSENKKKKKKKIRIDASSTS